MTYEIQFLKVQTQSHNMLDKDHKIKLQSSTQSNMFRQMEKVTFCDQNGFNYFIEKQKTKLYTDPKVQLWGEGFRREKNKSKIQFTQIKAHFSK